MHSNVLTPVQAFHAEENCLNILPTKMGNLLYGPLKELDLSHNPMRCLPINADPQGL